MRNNALNDINILFGTKFRGYNDELFERTFPATKFCNDDDLCILRSTLATIKTPLTEVECNNEILLLEKTLERLTGRSKFSALKDMLNIVAHSASNSYIARSILKAEREKSRNRISKKMRGYKSLSLT